MMNWESLVVSITYRYSIPSLLSSVADPEWIIQDPDPVLNFLSSWSESNPYRIIQAFLEIIKKHLKFNQKEESTNHLPFSISYYRPTGTLVQYPLIKF